MSDSQPEHGGTSPRAKALENARVSGDYADITITCKSQIWLAHRVVVCEQSKFFKTACKTGFKEERESRIDFPTDDPDAVDKMLAYLYTGCYYEAGETAPLLLNIQIIELADKLMIEPLASLATKKFNGRANTDWDTPSFAEAIVRIFSPAFQIQDSETLKLILLEVTRQHAKQLFDDSAHQAFQETILVAPRFMLDYTKSITSDPAVGTNSVKQPGLDWYRCPGYMCRKQRGVFGVSKKVPAKFIMNCPLKCTVDQSVEWWAKYKVEL